MVACLRRRLPKGLKVGHSGTLDPLATGLLVLLLGSATKKASLFQGLPKVYSGRIRLGVETDTGDLEGSPRREAAVPELSFESLQAEMHRHLGVHDIPPPLFSAVKYKGRPLYSYARRGIELSPKPRPQRVDEWTLLSWDRPELEFRLRCSGGTYVRSLAVHLGSSLGSAGVLSELRREAVGPFDLRGALGAREARELPIEQLAARLLPAEVPAPAS